MRRVYVQDLRPGMVLGKEIYNDQGSILLARGVTLTPRYIETLKSLGYYALCIRDGIADDVDPPNVLSDQVRVATCRHVRQLFAIAQSASAVQPGDKQRSPLTNLVDAALPNVAQLYRDVEMIIDRAMDVQVLSGVATLKSHDNYTFEHSVEMAVAGVLLGLRMHLPPFELHQLALGCLCHDIGKLAVPRDILHKPGPLSEEEYVVVRQHTDKGYEIVREVMGSSDILARHVVWQHHERQNGGGYPRGLRGTNEAGYSRQERFGRGLMLPVAEIAAVAEVYSSLASDQPYRPALPPVQIVATLRAMAGSQLNREVVKRFLSILPVFPVGTEVVVIAGRLTGCRGIVIAVNPEDIQRPVVRLLVDPNGQAVDPFEVDTSQDRDVELAVAAYSDFAQN